MNLGHHASVPRDQGSCAEQAATDQSNFDAHFDDVGGGHLQLTKGVLMPRLRTHPGKILAEEYM